MEASWTPFDFILGISSLIYLLSPEILLWESVCWNSIVTCLLKHQYDVGSVFWDQCHLEEHQLLFVSVLGMWKSNFILIAFLPARHHDHYTFRREEAEKGGCNRMQLVEARPEFSPWSYDAMAHVLTILLLCLPHEESLPFLFLFIHAVDLWWPPGLMGRAQLLSQLHLGLPPMFLALSLGLHHKTSLILQPSHKLASHAIEASFEMIHCLFHASLNIRNQVWI